MTRELLRLHDGEPCICRRRGPAMDERALHFSGTAQLSSSRASRLHAARRLPASIPRQKLELPVSSQLIPAARYIDPRGQRFGAGLSAVLLVVAFATQQFWLAGLVGLNLLIASALGTRLFLPGRPWALIRRSLRLGPAEPEHEYPPRFAQALGGIFIAAGTLGYLVVPAVGWIFVGAVATLQTILATTGYCLGCKMYFLRWWVPSLFAAVFRRNDRLLKLPVQPLRQV